MAPHYDGTQAVAILASGSHYVALRDRTGKGCQALSALVGTGSAWRHKFRSTQTSRCSVEALRKFTRRSVRPGVRSGASPPSPGCFLEVLILNGFQLYFPEVLIIQGLLLRVLILLDFKSFIISDLIKNEEFTEVLILEGLGRAARRRNGWIREGEMVSCGDPPSAERRLRPGARGGTGGGVQRVREGRIRVGRGILARVSERKCLFQTHGIN